MELTRVVGSSNVHSIGYDESALQLSVLFIGGDRYEYAGVPAEAFDALEKAESKGSFISRNIVGKYPSTKVPKP